MFNLPYISLPEQFTRLLTSNIQNSPGTNTGLELYLNEHSEMNALIKKAFRDIDPDGFLGKILSIAGWAGIRNRLAAVYLEYAMTGRFPDSANLNLVTDIVNIENKLRHFTPAGFSRSFLLAFYAKMTLIQIKKMEDSIQYNPLIIRDEHIDFMKHSKAKSVRIDWLMLGIVQYEHFLGVDRMNTLLGGGARYDLMMALLSPAEQEQMTKNFLTYGASIFDTEIFTMDLSTQG